jgi:hypothetical protein
MVAPWMPENPQLIALGEYEYKTESDARRPAGLPVQHSVTLQTCLFGSSSLAPDWQG